MIEFKMPSLGADMEAGTLSEWRVKPGDKVKRGDIIAEVDTQKGLIEIEVFNNGVIGELIVKEGEKVPVGIVMALIDSTDEPAVVSKESQAPVANKPKEQQLEPAFEASGVFRSVKVTPLARKIAEENHVNLKDVVGTGEDGAITKEDVEKAMMPVSTGDAVKTTSSTESIRMAVASAMSKSNREIPHYYLETTIDMSRCIVWLKEENKKRPIEKRLLMAAVLIKGVATVLKSVPELNAYWENGPVLKSDINIGFIVSLRQGGLMIPGILNADTRSVSEIMEALNDIIPRARALKLRGSEISNTTITITNIAEGGVEKVFGVIYPPQVAIIGFGSVSDRPFAIDGKVEVRPLMTVTLSGDHRASDGNTGSKFLMLLKDLLQKPELL